MALATTAFQFQTVASVFASTVPDVCCSAGRMEAGCEWVKAQAIAPIKGECAHKDLTTLSEVQFGCALFWCRPKAMHPNRFGKPGTLSNGMQVA